MKFEGSFINEKGKKVKRSFEAASESALCIQLGRMGWKAIDYKIVVDEKAIKKEIDEDRPPPFRWFYPSMKYIDYAEIAIKYAMVAAIISWSLTLMVLVYSWRVAEVPNASPSVLMDIGLLFLIIFGLRRKSRFAAIVLFIHFLLSKVVILSQVERQEMASTLFWSFIFLIFYFQGIRGTLAYHRLLESRLVLRNLLEKSLWGAGYGLVFALAGFLCLIILGSQGNARDWGLAGFGGFMMGYGFSMLGWLPLTKKKPVCEIPEIIA